MANMYESAHRTEFCFANFHYIGFDLDHTLIRYRLRALHEHVYQCIAKYLVEIKKFPPMLLNIPLNFDFMKKSVWIDKQKGNLLKLSHDYRVLRACHGTRILSKEEITQIYGEPAIVDVYAFVDENDLVKRFWHLPSYFEPCSMFTFATLVDLFDAKHPDFDWKKLGVNIRSADYSELMSLIYGALSYNFAQWGRGWYWRPFIETPEKLLFKSTKVRQWLEALKAVGVKLFLVTNSLPEYTHLLMKYSFGDNWQQLFEFVNVVSQKPGFFTQSSPFSTLKYAIDVDVPNDVTVTPRSPLSGALQFGCQTIYFGGNSTDLLELFHDHYKPEQPTHVRVPGPTLASLLNRPEVLYIGDHIENDVQCPKKYMGWETVAIVEELEDSEVEHSWKLPVREQDYDIEHGTTNSEHPSTNPYWGPFFHEDKHQTYYSKHLQEYATFYTPSLHRVAHFSHDHKFVLNDTSNIATINIDMLYQNQHQQAPQNQ